MAVAGPIPVLPAGAGKWVTWAKSWWASYNLNYLLSLVPWTYGTAPRIFEMAAGTWKAFGKAMVSMTPSLFFLAVNYGTIVKYFAEGLGIDVAKQKALRNLFLELE